jgi:transcriptional regulator with XRE-family HTH domain
MNNGFQIEIERRRQVDAILGTPEERKALRLALGLSLEELSKETGLSVPALRRRESPEWRRLKDSLFSEGGWAYIEFIAAARGIEL